MISSPRFVSPKPSKSDSKSVPPRRPSRRSAAHRPAACCSQQPRFWQQLGRDDGGRCYLARRPGRGQKNGGMVVGTGSFHQDDQLVFGV